MVSLSLSLSLSLSICCVAKEKVLCRVAQEEALASKHEELLQVYLHVIVAVSWGEGRGDIGLFSLLRGALALSRRLSTRGHGVRKGLSSLAALSGARHGAGHGNVLYEPNRGGTRKSCVVAGAGGGGAAPRRARHDRRRPGPYRCGSRAPPPSPSLAPLACPPPRQSESRVTPFHSDPPPRQSESRVTSHGPGSRGPGVRVAGYGRPSRCLWAGVSGPEAAWSVRAAVPGICDVTRSRSS